MIINVLRDSAGASARFSCVFMVRRILETEKSFGNGVDPSTDYQDH
jgi:hypothetical protein